MPNTGLALSDFQWPSESLALETQGWLEQLQGVHFPLEATELLPSTCDRFEEARHFLWLTANLPAESKNLQRGNWYAGFHISATIGIRDALQADYGRRNEQYKRSVLYREFFLRPDAENAEDRDPVGINRAYRELRNLRVHYAAPVIELGRRPVLADVGALVAGADVPTRWFLCALEGPSLRQLDQQSVKTGGKPLLTEEQRAVFNEFIRSRSFARVAAQHLNFLGITILEDCRLGHPEDS